MALQSQKHIKFQLLEAEFSKNLEVEIRWSESNEPLEQFTIKCAVNSPLLGVIES